MASAAVPAAAAALGGRRGPRGRAHGLAFLFLSPWIAGFLLFLLYPMVASLYFSFTHYDLLSSPRWIGLANYKYMLRDDPFFWQAVRNTAWMVCIGLPLRLFWALLTATLLTQPVRGQRYYRTLYYLPTLVPPVAGALAFTYLLNPDLGPVNGLLSHVGISGPLWFFDPSWSKPALVLLSLWGAGDAMIVYLAGLLDVPRTQIEAAKIDGANALRRYWHVTLPSISPVIFFTLVTGLIWTFQTFTEAYVAGNTTSGQKDTLGEPQGSLLFYAIWLYQQGFRYFNMGYASALAWVLFGATMLCTLVLIKSSERWVHVEGNS
jgi:multiple sugar transport system permease protein